MKKMKTISLVLLVAVVVFGGINIVNVQNADASIGCPVDNLCPSWAHCNKCWCSDDSGGGASTWICECESLKSGNKYPVAEIEPVCNEGPCYWTCPEPPG